MLARMGHKHIAKRRYARDNTHMDTSFYRKSVNNKTEVTMVNKETFLLFKRMKHYSRRLQRI